MRILLSGVAAMLVAVTPAMAAAEQWRQVAETPDYPLTLMFVDQSSIRADGAFRTGLVMTVLEESEDWTHSIIDRRVDCANRTTQAVHSRFYIDDELVEDDTQPSDVRSYDSGTMVEAVADAMCGRGEYMTEVIADPLAFSSDYFDTGW